MLSAVVILAAALVSLVVLVAAAAWPKAVPVCDECGTSMLLVSRSLDPEGSFFREEETHECPTCRRLTYTVSYGPYPGEVWS